MDNYIWGTDVVIKNLLLVCDGNGKKKEKEDYNEKEEK